MIDRVLNSMFHWYRLMGDASEGARVLERDGVLAAVVPAAPERAVVNAVLYRDAEGLEAAYDELASAYGEIGAKWTVWVPPGDEAAARVLKARGHDLDAQPMAMSRELDGVERPAADALANWTAGGDVAAVGEINDRSYTFGTDSFSRALQTLPAGVHVYIARDEQDAPICCLPSSTSSASSSDATASRTTTPSSSTATATTGSPPTPTGTSSTTATTT